MAFTFVSVSEMTNDTSNVSLSESHDYCRSHDHSESNGQLFMAFWEYTKRKPGEVSLRKGCVVDVLEKHLSGRPSDERSSVPLEASVR